MEADYTRVCIVAVLVLHILVEVEVDKPVVLVAETDKRAVPVVAADKTDGIEVAAVGSHKELWAACILERRIHMCGILYQV